MSTWATVSRAPVGAASPPTNNAPPPRTPVRASRPLAGWRRSAAFYEPWLTSERSIVDVVKPRSAPGMSARRVPRSGPESTLIEWVGAHRHHATHQTTAALCWSRRGKRERVQCTVGGVGKIFVVPAGALPVPVSERLYRLKTPNFLRPKPFYCRPRPAAQLLTICGCAVLFGQEELDDALCHGACVPGKRAGQVGSHGGLHKSKAELMYPGA